MTDYAKVRVSLVYSASSDYSDPKIDTLLADLALTPDEIRYAHLDLSTTAQTLDLGHYGSITAIIIKNLSATAAEIARAAWYTILGEQAAGSYSFANANPDTIADDNTNGTFVTNLAKKGRIVRVTHTDAVTTNDGTYLIDIAAVDLLTLSATDALSTNSADLTAQLSFESFNEEQIPAGGFLVITGDIQPAGDLVLDCESGTPEVEVYILGT